MAGDSPLQPITYIELTHTFDDWRVLTNQVLARVNNAASQNTAGSDYDQLSGSIVIRDTTGSFASNTITAELFHGNNSNIVYGNSYQWTTNVHIVTGGWYVNTDPITDPAQLKGGTIRTTDALLIPRGTDAERPPYPESGMMRWDDSMGQLTYYSELVNQWLGLGGGQIGDRDLDTRVMAELGPGSDEDTIYMFVGNTGDIEPVYMLNALQANLVVNAVFKSNVMFEQDATFAGNLTFLGSMTSIDTTSLSVEDKKINVGLVNGLRHKAVVKQRGPNIDIETTQPHGMGTGDRIFVTNLNDIVGMAEGLYLVQTAVNSQYMELTNLDGTGIGASVGNFQPEVSFSGPHTDQAVNNSGMTIPGNTEHYMVWENVDQYWHISDGMKCDNSSGVVLPKGTSTQRPTGIPYGYETGLIRFNSQTNTFEGVVEREPGVDTTLVYTDLRGVVDTDSASDTFINVYGNATNPYALVSDTTHTTDDIVLVAQGSTRLHIDRTSYAAFTSNSGLVIPRGTNAEKPGMPSTYPSYAASNGAITGMIRYNEDVNTYEGLAYDPDGTDNLEWISLSHMADSKSGNDTFISVYGHASNSTSVTPGPDLHSGTHTYDDMVFTTNGTERFYVDNTGWIEFSCANNSIRLPRGTTAQRPADFNYGHRPGSIRFNTDKNVMELLLNDNASWASIGGGISDSGDTGSEEDTFINLYGNIDDPNGVVASTTGGTDPHDGGGGDGHEKNDIVFVTNGTERLFVDNTGYIEATSNSTFRVPQGTVAQRPATSATGHNPGALRFNTDYNILEIVLNDGEWQAVGSLTQIDRDTWINVYGNAANGTAITSDANHDDNEMVVTTASAHALTIDKNQNVCIGPDSDALNTSPDARLRVDGTANITANVTMNDYLTGDNQSSQLTWAGHINVSNTAQFGNTMGVTGAVNMANTLTVVGATDVQNTFDVTGASTFANTMGVTGAALFSNTMGITGATSVGATLTVTGATTLSSTLTGVGHANFQSTVDIDSNLNVDGTAQIDGATTIDGTLNVKSNVDFDVDLNVDGEISVTANSNFDGDIFIEAGGTAAQYRILRSKDADGHSEWVDFGVFDQSNNRVF